MRDKIINYIRAGFAGLYLVTSEEARAEAEISAAAESLGCGPRAWSVTGGLIDPATVPLGVTMSEQISRLRQWAKNRARPASEGKTGTRSENTKRRIAA